MYQIILNFNWIHCSENYVPQYYLMFEFGVCFSLNRLKHDWAIHHLWIFTHHALKYFFLKILWKDFSTICLISYLFILQTYLGETQGKVPHKIITYLNMSYILLMPQFLSLIPISQNYNPLSCTTDFMTWSYLLLPHKQTK